MNQSTNKWLISQGTLQLINLMIRQHNLSYNGLSP